MNNDPLTLAWELSILERCVKFPNLSVASEHIGISQPQISRTVKKLETELDVLLLDRTSKRQTHWTPAALKIADEFQSTRKQFRSMLYKNFRKEELHEVRIGCLEGLSTLANQFAKWVFEEDLCSQIEIHVLDLGELSDHFHAGQLDLIFTSRSLGKTKQSVRRTIGYQNLSYIGDAETGLHVLSPTEKALSLHSSRHSQKHAKRLVTNSLAVKKVWMQQKGIYGSFPSEIFPDKRKSTKTSVCEPVLLIGSDKLPAKLQDFLIHFDPFKR